MIRFTRTKPEVSVFLNKREQSGTNLNRQHFATNLAQVYILLYGNLFFTQFILGHT